MKPKQTPEVPVVYQHNAISRAMYSQSTNARRLVAMAMSKIPPDGSGPYDVTFTYQEFRKALDLDWSSHTRTLVLEAVRECFRNHIEIEYPTDDGQVIWKAYAWFDEAKLISHFGLGDLKKTKIITPDTDKLPLLCDTIFMSFNPKFGEALKDFKLAYSKIALADLGKLQSHYAIRFYELAMSYSSLAGKEGNRRGEWYFPPRGYTIAELRALLMLDKSKYKDTKNFRVRIIDRPIQEINEAGIGLRITPDYLRRGKYLTGVRFVCRFVARGEARPVHPATETEEETRDFARLYPEQWAEAEKAVSQEQDLPGLGLGDLALSFKTYQKFKELYPGLTTAPESAIAGR